MCRQVSLYQIATEAECEDERVRSLKSFFFVSVEVKEVVKIEKRKEDRCSFYKEPFQQLLGTNSTVVFIFMRKFIIISEVN